jgi:hypothetical protein
MNLQIHSCRNLDFLQINPRERAAMYYILQGIATLNRVIIEDHKAIGEAVDAVLADINYVFVVYVEQLGQHKPMLTFHA